jgi:hypothetical protein
MSILTGVAVLAALGLSACEAHTAAGGPPKAETLPADDQATLELKEHHRHHHHGGLTQFIAMSLDTLGVDEANRPEIERLHSELSQCLAPGREVEQRLLLTFADGLAAGRMDTARVDMTIGQVNTAAAAMQDCSVGVLDKLHANLSPLERETLVDKIEAHWDVWQEVNHGPFGGDRERGGRLAELAQELNLTAEQVEKISAGLRAEDRSVVPDMFDRNKAEAHLRAFCSAFLAESFEAKSVVGNARLAQHGASRMALFYETVTPLLTLEQRATLADHLREHANHQPFVSSK